MNDHGGAFRYPFMHLSGVRVLFAVPQGLEQQSRQRNTQQYPQPLLREASRMTKPGFHPHNRRVYQRRRSWASQRTERQLAFLRSIQSDQDAFWFVGHIPLDGRRFRGAGDRRSQSHMEPQSVQPRLQNADCIIPADGPGCDRATDTVHRYPESGDHLHP